MESKELKRMGREELLQLLIQLTIEKEDLQKQLALKEEEIAQLRKSSTKHPAFTDKEPGSIAQAVLEANHVLEDTQRAADQYLESIARMQREQAIRCQTLINDAKAEAERILATAHQAAYQPKEVLTETNEKLLIPLEPITHPSAEQKKRNWRR